MFSVQQKRDIADAVQRLLRSTNHPELPMTEIQFHLHVDGAESWSWSDIRNNGAVTNPGVNPWNEAQALPQPIPLTERLPGPEDCNGPSGPYCWYGSVGINMGTWEWVIEDPMDDPVGYTHWLPASVDYLPARV
jgi:hypothetical protein